MQKVIVAALISCCLASLVRAKEIPIRVYAEGKTESAKTAAERSAVEEVVLEVLREEGLGQSYSLKARTELVTSCLPLLKRKKWRERRGRLRLTARIEGEDVRKLAIKGAKGKASKAKPSKISLKLSLKGSSIDDAEDVLKASAVERLLKSQVKVSAKAKTTVTAKVTLRYTAYAKGSAHAATGMLGQLSATGSVTVAEGDDTVGAFTLKMDPARTMDDDPSRGGLASLRVHKQGRSRAESESLYLAYVGRWLALRIARALNSGGIVEPELVTATGRFRGFDGEQVRAFATALAKQKGIKGAKCTGMVGANGTVKIEHEEGVDLLAQVNAVLEALKMRGEVRTVGKLFVVQAPRK